jgi:hypothetical protein
MAWHQTLGTRRHRLDDLRTLLDEPVVPPEHDEVTRLILQTHDAAAFAPIAHLTVGGLRDWLLSQATDAAALAAVGPRDGGLSRQVSLRHRAAKARADQRERPRGRLSRVDGAARR